MRIARLLIPFFTCCLSIAANPRAQSGDRAFYDMRFSKTPAVAAMTEVGRLLFFDRALSASGTLACASCHDPRYAYGPANARAVQRGGRDATATGTRAAPSLRYLHNVPPFAEHYEDDDQGGADQGPTGGRMWDGRADSAHAQAKLPLLSPFEMANEDAASVVAKVRRAPYATQFRETFGDDVFADDARAFDAVLLSLEVFEQSPRDFHPYSSKYDRWLRGQVELTAQERRGLALFDDPRKGNCASCHPSRMRQGALPAFTDFGFVALGVPRNRGIPANADHGFYDLGLCGPQRKDLADRADYCGLFRTPSLRNVAIKRTFFHNGAFHDLRRVLAFYASRDREPAKWYSHGADGRVRVYDDLPLRYRGNVNRDAPFDRTRSDPPALSAREIDDVIAFLRTLTDADLEDAPRRNPAR